MDVMESLEIWWDKHTHCRGASRHNCRPPSLSLSLTRDGYTARTRASFALDSVLVGEKLLILIF